MSKPKSKFDLTSDTYTPNRLLNTIARKLGTECYAEIAYHLRVDQALICRFRKRRYPLSPTLVLRIMEVVGLTLDEIRALSGVQTWVPAERKARNEKLETS